MITPQYTNFIRWRSSSVASNVNLHRIYIARRHSARLQCFFKHTSDFPRNFPRSSTVVSRHATKDAVHLLTEPRLKAAIYIFYEKKGLEEERKGREEEEKTKTVVANPSASPAANAVKKLALRLRLFRVARDAWKLRPERGLHFACYALAHAHFHSTMKRTRGFTTHAPSSSLFPCLSTFPIFLPLSFHR